MLSKITDRIYFLPIENNKENSTLGYIKGDNIAFMIDEGKCNLQSNLFLEELHKENLPYPVIKTKDIDFENKLSLDLGNINCHLINIDNENCEEDIIVWVPEEKVIFLGDIYNSEGKKLHNYGKKLSKLIQFLYETEFEYAISCNQGPITRRELIGNLENEYKKII